ncbi:hypothetical protein FEM48_Zijuj06G0168100 [Ziziphus jujuba var. spinosa]|uniref:Uncharacterized protein n=1 Tax=Ziziphus jujuba var. spinosa TaxID=714518 RepID=A0A978VAG3_ZIZJJ|nr:hypothetical protein FEM48_Zijuj06G0168100 [Ziziphus jujuba var. spinosa]
MARQLLLLAHDLDSTFQVGLAAMTLFLCAIALFMCASHSRKWQNWRACYEPDYVYDNTTIQHIQHANNEGTCSEEQEVSVWQKNILMGGKCQLPDFSGIIIYDSDGNVVTPAKKSRALQTYK